MIYLDNAATTRPIFFRDYTHWLNTNTDYAIKEKENLEDARKAVKNYLKVTGGKVLFFRCATEAINWLADRLEEYRPDRPMPICSVYEHDSVNDRFWSTSIWAGEIDVCQFVNNMTGKIFNIEAISKVRDNKREFFLSDFTAAIGKVNIPDNLEEYCDAIWFSGHKFYTEKGIGVMWISDKLANFLGATESPRNQYGLVYGTVDVAGAIMIAKALDWLGLVYADTIDGLEHRSKTLLSIISEEFNKANIKFKYACDDMDRTHAINAIIFEDEDMNGDALRYYLNEKEIYVGSGHSACSGEADYRVLEAFGLTKEEAKRTVRISFSCFTTIKEVKEFADAVIDFYRTYVEV